MTFALPAGLAPVLQIISIDVLLSGDNAVVIALACRALTDKQRPLGMALGAGAAILLRILLTFIVVEILQLPYVKLVGGLLLFWIAIRLALEDHGKKNVPAAASIFAAVRIIVVADTIMSLDNVVAIAAAAKGSLLLVAFGLALSVPFILFGATLFLALLSRYPMLIWAGTALLGYVGGDLIGADPLFAEFSRTYGRLWEIGCGTIGAVIVLVIALCVTRMRRHRTAA